MTISLVPSEILSRYDGLDPSYPMFDSTAHTDADAYDAQRGVAELRLSRGEKCCGFKLGMTSPRIMEQMGFQGPVRGYLWDSERYGTGARIHRASFCNLGLESEVAVTLRAPINLVLSNKQDILDAIYAWHAAIELHELVWQAGANKQQLVSCNAFNAGVVLSTPSHDITHLLQSGMGRFDIMCTLRADGVVVEDAPFSEVRFG